MSAGLRRQIIINALSSALQSDNIRQRLVYAFVVLVFFQKAQGCLLSRRFDAKRLPFCGNPKGDAEKSAPIAEAIATIKDSHGKMAGALLIRLYNMSALFTSNYRGFLAKSNSVSPYIKP